MDVTTLLTGVRRAAGLTQAQLASRAGTSQAAVARYENGTVSPSVATLQRLVRAAGADLDLGTHPAPTTDLAGQRAANLRRHRKRIIQLARAVGASNVRVFGSVARGTDEPDSDIDLLVDFDITKGLLPIIDLRAQLEDLLGERVDVAPVSALKASVAARALAEAVPL
ncbi:MAG: helix-turn-helix domain-containing protein [Actinomycetes bacterium]